MIKKTFSLWNAKNECLSKYETCKEIAALTIFAKPNYPMLGLHIIILRTKNTFFYNIFYKSYEFFTWTEFTEMFDYNHKQLSNYYNAFFFNAIKTLNKCESKANLFNWPGL